MMSHAKIVVSRLIAETDTAHASAVKASIDDTVQWAEECVLDSDAADELDPPSESMLLSFRKALNALYSRVGARDVAGGGYADSELISFNVDEVVIGAYHHPARGSITVSSTGRVRDTVTVDTKRAWGGNKYSAISPSGNVS